LICAQKHVTLVTEQIDDAQKTINDKINILEQLAATAKERVNAEREKIIQQADIQRDEGFLQIDQLLEQQKKHLQDKSSQLSQLSLDKVSLSIQRITNEIENLNEDNDQLFDVQCIPPKIQIQYKH
jgi:septation ring formation regulator EzrA